MCVGVFEQTIKTYGERATDISTRRQNLLQGKPQTEQIFQQGHLCAKPAMDAGLVSSIIQVKDDPNVPINMKWGKIRTMLLEKGLAWTSQEAPSAFLCHPSNRGGLMLSWHDCHDKGSSIATKLSQSVAFELASNPVTKAHQVKSNQELRSGTSQLVVAMSQLSAKLFCAAVPLMSHGLPACATTTSVWMRCSAMPKMKHSRPCASKAGLGP